MRDLTILPYPLFDLKYIEHIMLSEIEQQYKEHSNPFLCLFLESYYSSYPSYVKQLTLKIATNLCLDGDGCYRTLEEYIADEIGENRDECDEELIVFQQHYDLRVQWINALLNYNSEI